VRVICPSCGAGLSQKMVESGECGYCHTALPRAPVAPKIENKVVNVTKFEIKAPGLEVGDVAGRVIDGFTARLFGCLTGCLSTGVTLVITGMILLFVGWQLWMQSGWKPPVSIPSGIHAPSRRGGRN
jgi:hypothetical protein